MTFQCLNCWRLCGAVLLVLGAALLDESPVIDVEAARAAWSEVAWQRFQQADRAIVAAASVV